jgi:DNA processing protein
VLGTGVDVAYPRANLGLHREICGRGLVLSEFPPGTSARPHHFLQRNRIIAALARLTIVVEAPHKSGALNTCESAHDLGRAVAIVPGPIDSPQSAGSNHFLREGVHLLASIDDAITLAGLSPAPRGQIDITRESERRVWDALQDSAASLDELCARSALPVAQCLSTVTALEIRGIVECALTGTIRRR